MHRSITAALATVALAALALVPAAQASYHLMKISEVGQAQAVGPTSPDYVELQMFAAGQNFVGGEFIQTYNSDGTVQATFQFPSDVAFGDSQRTILIARDDGPGIPGVTPDFVTPDLVLTQNGAVCFGATFAANQAVDCVLYGTVAPLAGGSPSQMGAPAPELLTGTVLQRSITPNCPTLLEDADDTNDSATDFALGAPSPRPNAVTPTEVACAGGAGTDIDPPQTKIKKGPRGTVEDDTVKFKFKSDEQGSSFKCSRDGKRFRRCTSPKKLKNLDDGKHKFKVFAIDAAGNADPTPAKRKFKVVD